MKHEATTGFVLDRKQWFPSDIYIYVCNIVYIIVECVCQAMILHPYLDGSQHPLKMVTLGMVDPIALPIL